MYASCRPCREFAASLSAGDSWAWTVALDTVVAAGSTLIYVFRGPDSLMVAGTRSTDGLSFAFAATSDQTKGLARGIYTFQARLTVGANVQTLRTGTLKVLPNLADPNAEVRTQAEIDLANVLTTMRRIEASSNASFSDGGVSYSRADLGRLQARADRLKQQVLAEQGRGGAVNIRTVFGAPCGFGLRRNYP